MLFKKKPIENQEQMPEVISFQEIFNKVNDISINEIDSNELRFILRKKELDQEIVSLQEIEKIYNNIENEHLVNIVEITDNGTQQKCIRIATDSKDIASILNNILHTDYKVDQYGPANGGAILFQNGRPAQVNKKNLLNLIACKLKDLINEKNT
jgi:hypothetical protein